MAVFGVGQVQGRIPWFMYDIDNRQVITSAIIPGDIKDTKEILFAEQPVPGKGYAPTSPSGAGNRKISFTLQLIKRGDTVGNLAMLKQVDMLRHSKAGLFGKSRERFRNPQVLYYWGTGSVPLVYWVAKADATHKQRWVNQKGMPQYSEIQFELILDETHPVYKMEEQFRAIASFLGNFDLPISIGGGPAY